MTPDLVERLNAHSGTVPKGQLRDDLRNAADEIESLQKALKATAEAAATHLKTCADLRVEIERLSATQDDEPVAWQWRYCPIGSGTDNWSDWHDGHAPDFRGDEYIAEERPLYARPQAKPVDQEQKIIDRLRINRAKNEATPCPEQLSEDVWQSIPAYLRPAIAKAFEPAPVDADLREAVKKALRRWHRDTCYPDAMDAELEIGLNNILSLIASKSVPDGYVMVPREPTEAMIEAASEWSPLGSVAREIWSDMIAAAPQAGEGK